MQLVGGIAGAVVGSFFGMPQIGWMVGSALGGMMGQPDQHGPKLTDLSVQITSYGAAIPEVWGSMANAGNVVWATPKTPHESSESAKGGPSIITTTYTASFAVLISVGQHTAIRRIWANSRKAYDISTDADAATQAASSEFAQYFTFYPGDEDQEPDPTIESYLGAGNVPAMKGLCYVVFKDLPLDLDGNNIASMTIEMVDDEPEDTGAEALAPLVLPIWSMDLDGMPTASNAEYQLQSGATYATFAEAYEALLLINPWHTEFVGYYTSTNGRLSVFDDGATLDQDARFVHIAFNVEVPDIILNNGPGYLEGSGDGHWCTPLPCPGPGGAHSESVMAQSWGYSTPGNEHWGVGRMFGRPGPLLDAVFGPYLAGVNNQLGPVASGGGNSGCTNPGEFFAYGICLGNRFIRVERKLVLPDATCQPGDPCDLGIAELPSNPKLCITCDGTLSPNVTYELETDDTVPYSFKQLQVLGTDSYEILKRPLGPVLRIGDPNYNNSAFWDEQALAAGVAGSYPGSYPVEVTEVGVGEVESDAVDASNSDLAVIVDKVMRDCGYTEDQFDVTDLEGILVPAFTRTSQMRGRDVIEALRPIYSFDSVEIDRIIVFVRRSGVSTFYMGPNDLGVGETDMPRVRVVPTSAQESELPCEVSISYKARERDYEIATQTERRETVTTQQKQSIAPAIVLTPQIASDAASTRLYDMWVSRVRLRWTTTSKFTKHVPTNVGTINDGVRSYLVRIIHKVESPGKIEWEGVLVQPSVYEPNTTPSVLPEVKTTIHFAGPMQLVVMDMPPLRSQDVNDFGSYAAANGLLPSWSGGVAMQSVDDGDSYSSVKDMTRRAVMGYATTALPNFFGGNVVDEVSTVTVQFPASTPALATITNDQLYAGGNAFGLGQNGRWEIGHFKRAELVAPNIWKISGILRGQKATEQYMGTHVIGDRFILLDPARMYNISATLDSIDRDEIWKGVSYSTPVESAWEVPFTNTGERYMPRSPVQLNVIPLVEGGYQATWIRRTRGEDAWLDEVEVPLSEDSERYLVEVLDGDEIIESQIVTEEQALLGNPASDPALTLQMTYGAGTSPFMVKKTGSNIFGFLINDVNLGAKRVGKFDVDGVFVQQSPSLGEQTIQLAHSATNVYALTYGETSSVPSYYTHTTVSRLAMADITTVAATSVSGIAGDYKGMAFDGTNVYVTEASTSLLHKLDATTLAGVESWSVAANMGSIWYDGAGYLWICRFDGGVADKIIKWNIATETIALQFDCLHWPIDVRVVSGLAFVRGQSGIGVYNATTGAEVIVHDIDPSFLLPQRGIEIWGSYVVFGQYPGVLLLDATTGSIVQYCAVPGISVTYIAGVIDGELVLGGSPTAFYLNMSTRSFTLDAAITSSDYSGFTVRVAQLSATIGSGHPTLFLIP